MKWPYSLGEREKNLVRTPRRKTSAFKKHTEEQRAENDLRSPGHEIRKAPKGNAKDCPIALIRSWGFLSLTVLITGMMRSYHPSAELRSEFCEAKSTEAGTPAQNCQNKTCIRQNLFRYCCLGLLWRHDVVCSVAIFYKLFVFHYWFVCVPYVLYINLFLKYRADNFSPKL